MAAPHQRVIGPGDEDDDVFEEGLGNHRLFFRRAAHDVEVIGVAGQPRQQRLAVGDLKPWLYPRKAAFELAQQLRQEILRGRYHRHRQRPGHRPAHIVQRCLEVGEPRQHVARGRRHLLPGAGQAQALAELLGERLADLLFQRLHLHRHRGLRQVHLFGGAGDRAKPRHRLEQTHLLDGGRDDLCHILTSMRSIKTI